VATIKYRSLIFVLFTLALSLDGVPSHAATPSKQGTPGPSAAEPARTPTMKESMAQVVRIADELKQIDARLQHLEKSVAGIDKSLGPVGIALKEDVLRAILNEAGDVAFNRGKSLILLGTACLAALMVLYAFLRRWRLPAPRATERKDG
jgi:hypothetical protein